jgi:hypothetical protein
VLRGIGPRVLARQNDYRSKHDGAVLDVDGEVTLTLNPEHVPEAGRDGDPACCVHMDNRHGQIIRHIGRLSICQLAKPFSGSGRAEVARPRPATVRFDVQETGSTTTYVRFRYRWMHIANANGLMPRPRVYGASGRGPRPAPLHVTQAVQDEPVDAGIMPSPRHVEQPIRRHRRIMSSKAS